MVDPQAPRYREVVSEPIRTADVSTIRVLDGAVIAWILLWLIVGVWSAVTIWELSELGDTVSRTGQSIGNAGSALKSLEDVPVVGERPGEVGRDALVAGAEIDERGQLVESQMRQLAVLLGVAICLIPTTPVAGLYLPLRIARRHEIRSMQETLRRHPDDEGLDRYLAERALRSHSYAQVRDLVADPWAAIDDGRTRILADAELARLGLTRR